MTSHMCFLLLPFVFAIFISKGLPLVAKGKKSHDFPSAFVHLSLSGPWTVAKVFESTNILVKLPSVLDSFYLPWDIFLILVGCHTTIVWENTFWHHSGWCFKHFPRIICKEGSWPFSALLGLDCTDPLPYIMTLLPEVLVLQCAWCPKWKKVTRIYLFFNIVKWWWWWRHRWWQHIFIECLLWARHCPECFAHIILLNPLNSPMG